MIRKAVVTMPRKEDPTAVPTAGSADWEELLEIYILSVYLESGDQYRQYFQHSIVATTMAKEPLEEKIVPLIQQIQKKRPEHNIKYDLYSRFDMIEKDHKGTTPEDSVVVCINRGLTVALQSPQTGQIFYDTDFQYCPESGRQLIPVVTSEPKDTS